MIQLVEFTATGYLFIAGYFVIGGLFYREAEFETPWRPIWEECLTGLPVALIIGIGTLIRPQVEVFNSRLELWAGSAVIGLLAISCRALLHRNPDKQQFFIGFLLLSALAVIVFLTREDRFLRYR